MSTFGYRPVRSENLNVLEGVKGGNWEGGNWDFVDLVDLVDLEIKKP